MRASKGSVRISAGPPGTVGIRYRADFTGPVLAEPVRCEKGVITVAVSDEAKDREIILEITAPPGLDISAGCRDAAVDVTGEWGSLDIRTTSGAIAARVDRVASGTLESASGAIEFAVLGPGPTGDFTAKSISGDVTVRLPAPWGGQVHFLTQTGTLDVPPHSNFRTKWDEDGKGVVGHVGPPREKGAPLPTVWGTSASGLVSFRIGE